MPFTAAPHPTIRVFVDFDGTITREDVGDAIFTRAFGSSYKDLQQRLTAGLLTPGDFFSAVQEKLRTIDPDLVYGMIDEYHIEGSFVDFVRWCNTRDIPVMILSDGFDIYIEPMLKNAGLSLPLRCNAMTVNTHGFLEMTFPSYDPSCRWSGNCKRNHVVSCSGERDTVILAGDGYSDFCAAPFADLVFAKGTLVPFCQRGNIAFQTFRTFHEITEGLEKMTGARRLRQKVRTRRERHALWLSG